MLHVSKVEHAFRLSILRKRRIERATLRTAGAVVRLPQGLLTMQSLPEDVLGIIWLKLPLYDILSVTKVCSAWRAAALDMPLLWTDINCWTKHHGDHISCSSCDSRSRFANGGLRPHDNLDFVDELLRRSRLAPLNVVVHHYWVGAMEYSTDGLKHIGARLAPHSGRIKAISIYASESDAAFDLLNFLPLLPTVERMVLAVDSANLHGVDSGSLIFGLLSSQAGSLSVLRHLELFPGINWNRGATCPEEQLETIRELHCATSDNLFYPSRFPALEVLYVNCKFFLAQDIEHRRPDARYENLKRVSLDEVSSDILALYLERYHQRTVAEAEIKLSYRLFRPDVPLIAGFLAEADSPTEVDVEVRGRGPLTVTSRRRDTRALGDYNLKPTLRKAAWIDDNLLAIGKLRNETVPRLRTFFVAMNLTRIERMRILWLLRHAILDARFNLPALRKLQLDVLPGRPYDFGVRIATRDSSPRLPSLNDIVIIAQEKDADLSVSASDLRDFVKRVTTPERSPPVVTLQSVTVDGSVAAAL